MDFIELHPNAKDISTQRFGRLIAVGPIKRRQGRGVIWLCQCDCGNKTFVETSRLNSGNTQSCGCLLDWARHTTHGASHTPEFRIWRGMKNRCTHESMQQFKNYGGRGITVCERWRRSFENFFEDMGPRPSPRHSLDRYPNNDGNYEPSNCRWATPEMQAKNKRNNRMLTAFGETLHMSEWARRVGMTKHALHERLKSGMTIESALQTPLQKKTKKSV